MVPIRRARALLLADINDNLMIRQVALVGLAE